MTPENLPRTLRVLRAQRGLSLTEAAEAIGVTRDTLSEIERGKRQPYMPTLAKIARGYGVPVEDLLEGPVLAGKAEAPREAGRTEYVPRKTLEAHGITISDAEFRALNDNLEALRRGRETDEPFELVTGEGVDSDRMVALMVYVSDLRMVAAGLDEAIREGTGAHLTSTRDSS